jgi:hypothetical protein
VTVLLYQYKNTQQDSKYKGKGKKDRRKAEKELS